MVHEVTGSPGPRPTQPPFQAQPPFNPQGESAAQAAVKNQQEEAVKAALDKLNQGPKVTGSPHWKPSMGTGCLR